MPFSAEVTELSLRAVRVVETRLMNLLGDVPTDQAMDLLALELSEVDEGLDLVAAVAAVAAVAVIMLAQSAEQAPEHVIAQIRSVMNPQIE